MATSIAAFIATAFLSGLSAQDSDTIRPAVTETDGKQIFARDYFDQFVPQTAADMLRNVPGFQLKEAEDRRGLGQGGTNVLINGSRVSGKTNDPLDVLDRTAASAVDRIEIVDGASLGISGLSGPVANVIVNLGQTTTNWEWRPQIRKGAATRLLRGSTSVGGSFNGIAYSVGAELEQIANSQVGIELVTGANGELLETRREVAEPKGLRSSLSLTLNHQDQAGREANFAGELDFFDFRFSERSERDPVDINLEAYLFVFSNERDEWSYELSADYALDLLGGRFKMIGLQSFEHEPGVAKTASEALSGFFGGSRFESAADSGESILRAEQSWSLGEERILELSGEGAFNFRETEAEQFAVDANQNETQVVLVGANTRIEERRGELSLTYGFPIGTRLDVQASVASEFSELTQTGDFSNERTFTRPKGFVSATYQFDNDVELRTRLDRRVGQLDFGAFASSVNLNNNNQSTGNAELVPEQSWFMQAALEKAFEDGSQLTFSVETEEFEDVVQLVPIGSGEGFGNVDAATRTQIEFLGTVILDRFGVEGGQFDWELAWQDSEIEDPFTAQMRKLDDTREYFLRVEYRHDVPNTPYAYGFFADHFEESQTFRRSEIRVGSRTEPATRFFLEHKDFFGASAELYVFNINNFYSVDRRDVFDGARPNAPFLFREARTNTFGTVVGFNFKGTL